ncbi:hypothetical protein D9615_002293 [Tricholomella constricta]|uniref:C2H2-type domain-containing protein n=1 Tax=Tricholomella constricta TaxID=117010 RepID=A0A8H5HM12_9AGAR|nr:hypothetical protein D9615_002293 [Tricholomella constricta]
MDHWCLIRKSAINAPIPLVLNRTPSLQGSRNTNGPIQGSVPSYARPATNLICVRLTSKPIRGAIFLSPPDHCFVPMKIAENVSGHHSIYGYIQIGTMALNPFNVLKLAVLKHSQNIVSCVLIYVPIMRHWEQNHTAVSMKDAQNPSLPTSIYAHIQRYMTGTCLPDIGNMPAYYTTWTALQQHIRAAHPPTCIHVSCNGRTFSSQKGLRAHQKLHEQRELDQEMGAAVVSDAEDVETTEPPLKRRRGGEIGRDWKCDIDGCDKDFKSKRALKSHTNIIHLGRRDHICFHEGCGQAYGYKHLLRRHLAKAHDTTAAEDDNFPDDNFPDGEETNELATTSLDIDTITGNSYAKRTLRKLANATALLCPHPRLEMITWVTTHHQTAHSTKQSKHGCEYAFSRAYDLRRHLKTAHGVNAVKESVDRWVKEQKAERRRAT